MLIKAICNPQYLSRANSIPLSPNLLKQSSIHLRSFFKHPKKSNKALSNPPLPQHSQTDSPKSAPSLTVGQKYVRMVLEKQKAALSNPLLPQPLLMDSPKYEPPLTRRHARAQKVMEEQKALSNTPLPQPLLTQAHASCCKILKTIKKRKDVNITEVMTTEPPVEQMAPRGTIQKKKPRYAPNHLSSYSTPRRSNRVATYSHEKSKCGPTMGMGLIKAIGGSSRKKVKIGVDPAIGRPRNRKESALFSSQIGVGVRKVLPVPKKLKDVDLKSASKKGFGELLSPQQNHKSKRVKLRTILHSQDLIDASGGKSKEVNPTLEDNVFCNAPIHEFENQPLSKWVKGMRTPSTEPSLVNAVEQPMENQEMDQGGIAVIEEISEKHNETEVPIPTMVDKHPIVLKEPRNMPFAKNNHIWKIFENMDAFKNIPQNPHFQPLEQIKEPLREGKAIGYIVNFADMLWRISELKFGDPKSVADDFLEALAELETHGFNVRLLKYRVVEFVKEIGKKENLLGDVNDLNSRIQEHHQKKGKIEEEIGGIREEIRKLEEKLSVYVSAKGKVEDEILDLGERLNETEKGIQNVRHGFEGGSSVFLSG